MKRKILVISRNEQLAKWFRYMLGGRRKWQMTQVVADLQHGIRTLKRSYPHVVIFVEEGPEKADDRLMLLRALLLIEEQSQQNTLAILYDRAASRMMMYHNVHVAGVNQWDVALAAQEVASCPLFGSFDAPGHGFPKDCHFLPLLSMGKAVAEEARAVPMAGHGIKKSK